MTLERLAAELSRRTGREVRAIPEVLETERLGEAGAAEVVYLANVPARAQAVLAALVQGGRASVVCGEPALLREVGEDVVRAIGPGRCVDAREWKADRAAALHGRSGAARLPRLDPARPRSLAENPLPPSPRVREALASRESQLNRYPPLRPLAMEAALAARHCCAPDEVVVALGGSQEVLARCLRAFTDPRGLVVAPAPTYDQLAGLCFREGRLFAHDGLAHAALAYVASPNNPDSRELRDDEREAIRAQLPPDRVLVLDRAWAGFQSDEELFAPRPAGAVVVVQTFSKLFGIAGLRIGYALAPAPLADLLRRHSAAYELPDLLEAAAIASLEDGEYRQIVRIRVAEAREKLATGLERKGWRVPRTTTHVLLAWPPAERYAAVVEEIETRGLAIEECPQLEGALQLAVPPPEAVDALLAALS